MYKIEYFIMPVFGTFNITCTYEFVSELYIKKIKEELYSFFNVIRKPLWLLRTFDTPLYHWSMPVNNIKYK